MSVVKKMTSVKYSSLEVSAGVGGGEVGAELTDKVYTVDDAIEHIGFGWAQFRLGLICGICWTADAAEIMVLTILGPILLCEWGISRMEEALITTLVFLGQSAGSTAFGYLADNYGRKKSIMFSAIWLLFYAILSAEAPNLIWLLILRFMVGFGIGGCPQVVTYFSEFVPVKPRGRILLSMEAFWTLGAMLQVVLALLLVPLGWRAWLLASTFPVLVFVILMNFLPNSPRFLLSIGQVNEAFDVLNKMAKSNKKSMPEGTLLPLEPRPHAQFQDLLTPEFRRTTILLSFLWFVTPFNYFGLVLFTTDLINFGNTCNIKISSFLEEKSCGFSECQPLTTQSYIDILLMSLAEVPGQVVGIILVDLIGRKKTLMLVNLLFAVGCGLLMICQPRIPMLMLLFLCRASLIGAVQIMFLYTAEIYPSECRAISLGYGNMLSRVGAIITPYMAQVLLSKSLLAALLVYSVTGLLAVIAVSLFPIETKGRKLRENY